MTKWTNTELLDVVIVIQDDEKFNREMLKFGIRCPVCETYSLDYQGLKAWCRHCNTGMNQGDDER